MLSPDYAAWFRGPYGRQLARQALDLLRRDPHGVIDVALRIHATVDGEAWQELLRHAAELSDEAELQAEHAGQIARVGYLACLVLVLVGSADGAPTEAEGGLPDWLREIGRDVMGLGDPDR